MYSLDGLRTGREWGFKRARVSMGQQSIDLSGLLIQCCNAIVMHWTHSYKHDIGHIAATTYHTNAYLKSQTCDNKSLIQPLTGLQYDIAGLTMLEAIGATDCSSPAHVLQPYGFAGSSWNRNRLSLIVNRLTLSLLVPPIMGINMRHTVTVSFEMDERTAKLFLNSSIERVINTSIRCIEKPDLELRDINLEDWEEWKPVVCSMWNALHDAIYRAKASMPANDKPYQLVKGDL